MMNRIDKKFRELRSQKRTALIIYITVGDPDLARTEELIFEIEKSGADIIELGIPFSDPLADGPTIQAASQRALKNNVSLKDALSLVSRIRKKTEAPIAFMTYYNPVYRFGVEQFVRAAKAAGVDGVIIPDLPPEEAKDLISASRKADFSTVFLLAPTSSAERIKKVCGFSTGFVYYVSLTGVTGARRSLPATLKERLSEIKKVTNKPVCVGFGVSNPAQANELARISDGIIVGSAVIKIIEKNLGKKDLVEKVGNFVRGLRYAVR